MGKSFIQLNRGLDTIEVLKDPKAFALLTQIALRARRTESGPNFHGLKVNEALVGDYESIGLSEQEYRSAKKRLSRYGLATFKGTNKGTIATLCNTSIYEINADESNDPDHRQATSKQRSSNDQTTTNNKLNNVNNEKNVEEDTAYPFDDFWDDYAKKKERKKCERKWKKVSESDRIKIKEFIPIYKKHKPEKQYRKNPSTFLNNEIWNDDWSEYPPKDQQNGNRKTKADEVAEYILSDEQELPSKPTKGDRHVEAMEDIMRRDKPTKGDRHVEALKRL